MRPLFRVLISLTLVCCTLPALRPLQLTPAKPEEYSSYRGSGHAIVLGQAFLTTRGGEVRKAAGSPVTLDPATSLAREWCDAVCDDAGERVNGITDSVFLAARRTTKADGDGHFSFANVPPGRYLVRTSVLWWVGQEPQGGMMAELVDVPDTGRVEVIMSRLGNPYTRAK